MPPLLRYKRIRHPRYKYELTADYVMPWRWELPPFTESGVGSGWAWFEQTRPSSWSLSTPGVFYPGGYCIRMAKGYAWNGASGAIDTPTWMRGSAVHDALYALMREGFVPKSYRSKADRIMREIILEVGMLRARAWYSWAVVRATGWRAIR